MKTPKKNKIWAIGGIVVPSFVCAVLFFGVIYWFFIPWMYPFDGARFTTEAWADSRNDERAPMVLDLVTNHLPTGLSQQEVEKLLGSPDKIITAPDSGGIRPLGVKTYVYKIGSWTHYKGFDDAFVYVHLDEDGKVIKAEINGY
jgi:hypothetical protein